MSTEPVSERTATRIAPDVPMLIAMRSVSTAPLPTLEQAPSPDAGDPGQVSVNGASVFAHSSVSPDHVSLSVGQRIKVVLRSPAGL